MEKNKIKIGTGSTDQFFTRIRKHAAALDRGEILLPEITITFEDPRDLLRVLSSERVRLLQQAKTGVVPISTLASGLKRDVRSVSRDVAMLEKAGLLRTEYGLNPGHGKYKIVAPVARIYNFAISL